MAVLRSISTVFFDIPHAVGRRRLPFRSGLFADVRPWRARPADAILDGGWRKTRGFRRVDDWPMGERSTYRERTVGRPLEKRPVETDGSPASGMLIKQRLQEIWIEHQLQLARLGTLHLEPFRLTESRGLGSELE